MIHRWTVKVLCLQAVESEHFKLWWEQEIREQSQDIEAAQKKTTRDVNKGRALWAGPSPVLNFLG